jgi:hypothetical protein
MQVKPILKQLLLSIFILMTITVYAQKLTIITADKSKVVVTLLDSASKSKLIAQLNGKQSNELRKKWTARTFRLADGRILIEFYDRQAVLISGPDDFKSLADVRFVKNTLALLKKNISYKIEMGYNEGLRILQNEKPARIDSLKSDVPDLFDFEVYQMATGQLLFLDKSKDHESATIYPDIKTLAADNETIAEEVYNPKDDEYLMKRLAAGDTLPDYEPDMQLVYPKYLKGIIRNHRLTLIEQKVYVSELYSNLYKSANGYYMLIDEVNQKNGSGNEMPILSLWIYPTIQQVRDAQNRYKEFKRRGVISEHFYQKISDKYGQRFPEFVNQLIDILPALMNIDKEQVSQDSLGMSLVDESLKWNYVNNRFFDSCFPALLAYYGQCYIKNKKVGKWGMILDNDNVWIPMVKLNDGSNAWDWRHFYKDLYEGPIPLTWAGNWDGMFKYK